MKTFKSVIALLLAALMLTAADCIVWAHCPPVSIPNEYSDFIEDDELAELRRSALKFKAIPHNSKCAGCAGLALQVLRFFRQTIQKSAGRVPPLSRIFVKYDGKDASRCVLKAQAANCAVLP